jgi:hypothetical protein
MSYNFQVNDRVIIDKVNAEYDCLYNMRGVIRELDDEEEDAYVVDVPEMGNPVVGRGWFVLGCEMSLVARG